MGSRGSEPEKAKKKNIYKRQAVFNISKSVRNQLLGYLPQHSVKCPVRRGADWRGSVVEAFPIKQKVTGWILGLGCGLGPSWPVYEKKLIDASHIDVSLFLLQPLSLKINK